MATGSHKDILQARAAETEEALKAAAQEDERLRTDLKSAQEEIDQLQTRYERACRAVAERDPRAEDPAALLAQRDQRSHYARGLQVLVSESGAAAQAASVAHVEAARALQAQLEIEEGERLKAAIADAEKKRDAAQATLNAAEQVVANAKWARRQFLSHQELKAQGKA